GLATLVRYADITHTTLTEMRGTTSPRLMLELLSARMLLPDAASDSAALLQRIERLERRQGMVEPAAAADSDGGRTAAQRSPARPAASAGSVAEDAQPASPARG